jgi:hypothetical protein
MANEPPLDPLLDDPFIEEHVERALAPYRGVWPPEVLSEFADEIRIFLLTHPVAERALSRIRPRKVLAASDDVQKPGTPNVVAIMPRKGKVGTGDPR